MPRNANAKRDDGQLHITYNEMGQGDNILIACPNGEVVVIDCGAARWDGNYFTPPARPEQLREKAVNVLFEACFFGNNQTVSALILTHADKDHCNELKSLFDHTLTGTAKVAQIDALYHSSRLDDYIEGSAANYLTVDLPPLQSYAITVNATECTLNGTNIPDSAIGTAEIRKKSLQAATQGFIKIIDGTKAGGAACNVYILASNVRSYVGISDGYGDAPEAVRNRSSVVTMVVYGDKKFLFLGDATFHTEKFLKDTYGARIADVEMLHVGHHASYRTSSSYRNSTTQDQAIKDIDFISHVNPRILAISAAYDSGSSLKLPRWETIANYIAGANRLTEVPAHRIHCWWNVPEKWTEPPIATRVVPKRTKPKKDYTAAYNDVGYRATNRHILCTGTDGVLDFDYQARSAGGGRFIVEPVA
jgi:beta-lactamase superfamily II metal-dependent hydrolase